jgi:hypothetical protein
MIKCLENPNKDKKHMVIVTTPWIDTMSPLMAPAALKSAVEAAGFSCFGADINFQFKEHINQCFDSQNVGSIIHYFSNRGSVAPEIESKLLEIFDQITDQILSFDPEWVGLSLLTYTCQHATEILARSLKQKNPSVKIVIGGPGIIQGFNIDSVYARSLLAQGVIDFYVHGDGEISLIQLLQGNLSYPGINDPNWRRFDVDQINAVPIPNYDDYDLDSYENVQLSVVGSRGCVRQCTYCDYIVNWDRYVWRKAENIFAEILHLFQTYNINHFKFQDSLVNGNQKEFMHLLELLAEHNENSPHNQIRWSGMYIFREPTVKSSREWELLSKSCFELQVGIENFNQRVRYAMGKKFSDESILYHLQQAKKHNIIVWILLIVGYVDETEEEHQQNIQWIKNHGEFSDILIFRVSTGLHVLPNTYLGNNAETLGITLDKSNHANWVNDTTGLDQKTRVKWCLEMFRAMRQRGFNYAVTSADNHTFERVWNTTVKPNVTIRHQHQWASNHKKIIPIKQNIT